MSVIYGIVMFNNQHMDPAKLDTMRSAMDFWGPDGQGEWCEESAGFGNLLLFNTPEAVFEKMPFVDPSGELVFTCSARIDNRSELCRLFRISPGEAMHLPDSYFIMRAYQRWGEDCVNHLLGDWSFAVWNRKTRKLFLARDHHGITALYFYRGKDFFVFSSSLKGILCFEEIKKEINEYKIAQILVGWNEGGPETCYKEIFRLPPAHTMIVDGEILNTLRYWYPEKNPELRLSSEQQYLDVFLDLYTESVKERLRSYGPVGATLSGGLDSGSVCVLASQELKKEGKRLPAFTAVPLYDTTGLIPKNRIGDEGPLAMETAELDKNIDHFLCKALEIDPLEGVYTMTEVHEQPVFMPVNSYWITDLILRAKEVGVKSILIGQGGNSTVSFSQQYVHKNNFQRVIGNLIHFDNILLNTSLSDRLKKKYFGSISNKLKLIRAFNNNTVLRLLGISQSIVGANWNANGLNYRVEFRDPTVSKKIIEFTFQVSHFFQKKSFVQSAFVDHLPESVLTKQKKGIQSGDLQTRLVAIHDKLKAELILLRGNELLNQKWINNGVVNRKSAGVLLKSISVNKFYTNVRSRKSPALNHLHQDSSSKQYP